MQTKYIIMHFSNKLRKTGLAVGLNPERENDFLFKTWAMFWRRTYALLKQFCILDVNYCLIARKFWIL